MSSSSGADRTAACGATLSRLVKEREALKLFLVLRECITATFTETMRSKRFEDAAKNALSDFPRSASLRQAVTRALPSSYEAHLMCYEARRRVAAPGDLGATRRKDSTLQPCLSRGSPSPPRRQPIRSFIAESFFDRSRGSPWNGRNCPVGFHGES